MRSEHASRDRRRRGGRLAAGESSPSRPAAFRALSVLSVTAIVAAGLSLGCVTERVVLSRGGADQGPSTDGGPAGDAGPTDAAVMGNVTIYLSGLTGREGLTVRGRLGALSASILVGTVDASGVVVLEGNQQFTLLGTTYFEFYVDLDSNGRCSILSDQLGSAAVSVMRDGDRYRVDLNAANTSPPLLGCGSLP